MTTHAPAPRWQTATCFILPVCLYSVTAARTVQGGDAGEFGIIGMLGGVPHPPGYPLYSLLARLMGFVPLNPPFFRIALTSVLCSAAAVAVVQRIAWRLTGSAWVSGLTALAFATGPIQWRLAGIPEVFPLHALTVALAILCTLRVLDAPKERARREATWLGLILGLGMANHLTTVFCAPLVLVALWSIAQRSGARSAVGAMAGVVRFALLGMTPYLFLILWAHLDPLQSWIWGRTGTLGGVLSHFLRQEYGTWTLSAAGGAKPQERWHWLQAIALALPRQYEYVGFIMALGGIAVALRRHRPLALGLLGSLLLAGVLFPSLMNFPRSSVTAEAADRFFLMPAVLLAPLVALGLAEAQTLAQRVPVGPGVALIVAAASVNTYPSVNWRADPTVERYTLALVQSLPPNAVILGLTDTMLPALGWVNRVLHVRPDVHYIDINLIGLRWFYDRVVREIPDYPAPFVVEKADPAKLGLLLSANHPTYLIPSLVNDARAETKLEPAGLLYRVTAHPVAVSPDEMKALLDRDMALVGELAEPVDAWSSEMQSAMAFPWADLIDTYEQAGRKADADKARERIARILPPDLPDDEGLEATVAKHP